jgi:anti-sigma factor RsiW
MPAVLQDHAERFPSQEDLVAYLDGELDEDASRRIEELLRTNPDVREEVQRLERAWDLLGELPKSEADENFTQTTVEIAAVQAQRDLAAELAARPRKRRLQWLVVGLALAAAGFVGVMASQWLWPQTDEALLKDMPVLEHLDEFNQADNIQFLRRLRDEKLFTPGAESSDQDWLTLEETR